jgi:hypothetical protein
MAAGVQEAIEILGKAEDVGCRFGVVKVALCDITTL